MAIFQQPAFGRPPTGGGYRDPAKMTIKALQSRMKAAQEAAAQAQQVQNPIPSPLAGIAHLAGVAATGFGQSQAERAEASGRDQLARAMTRTDPTTGLPTQDALAEITSLDPETGQRLMEKIADLRRDDLEYQRTRADKLADRSTEWGHEAEINTRELTEEEARLKAQRDEAERLRLAGVANEQTVNQRELTEEGARLKAQRDEAERLRLAGQQGGALRIVTGDEAKKMGGDPARQYRISADGTTLEDVTPEATEQWKDIPTPSGETGQWQQSSTTGERKRIGGAGVGGPQNLKILYDQQDQFIETSSARKQLERARNLLTQGIDWGNMAGIRNWAGDYRGEDAKALADRTKEYNSIMNQEAIKSMSATLSGASTEGEMQRFIEDMNNPALDPKVKANLLDSMMAKVAAYNEQQGSRIKEMGGTVPGVVSLSPEQEAGLLQEARDAIAAGAPPDLVRKRLADKGVKDLGKL